MVHSLRRAPARLAACLSALLLAACGADGERASEQVAGAPPGPPRLPRAEMQRLVDSVDYVDYLFHELDFSMSLDDERGVRYALAQIGEEAAVPAATCKPIGRIFYQISGEVVAQADLYFSAGCTYVAFVDDAGAVTYVNEMSDVGEDFLNNQFAQLIDGYRPVE